MPRSLLIAALMALTLTACGKKDETPTPVTDPAAAADSAKAAADHAGDAAGYAAEAAKEAGHDAVDATKEAGHDAAAATEEAAKDAKESMQK